MSNNDDPGGQIHTSEVSLRIELKTCAWSSLNFLISELKLLRPSWSFVSKFAQSTTNQKSEYIVGTLSCSNSWFALISTSELRISSSKFQRLNCFLNRYHRPMSYHSFYRSLPTVFSWFNLKPKWIWRSIEFLCHRKNFCKGIEVWRKTIIGASHTFSITSKLVYCVVWFTKRGVYPSNSN